MILPLRGFLGVTFIYAGLQKLANPSYLDPHNRASVVGQIQTLRHTSPIGGLLGLSLHAPTLVGLLIAFGELAVGLGVLAGLWTRLAAVGGMLLSLTFLLTVSWNTTPYYYGSDIVFLFAWATIAAFGASDVLSLDGWLRARVRSVAGLRTQPTLVTIEAPQLRKLCPRAENCGLRPTGQCTRRHGCPVFPTTKQLHPAQEADLDRRTLLLGARTVGVLATAAAATGGITAALGRLAGGTGGHKQLALGRHTSTTGPGAAPSPSGAPRNKPSTTSSPAPGTPIGRTSAVPIGQAATFTDPASGNPGYVVHPAANRFLAFSAVCTHAGCTVGFDANSMQFICPCHGGTFDATTGEVLGGPPPSPLPPITVHIVNGEIRVD